MFGKGWLRVIGIIFLTGASLIASLAYLGVFKDNVSTYYKSNEIFIRQGSTIESLLDSMTAKNILISQASFRTSCRFMGFSDKKLKEGRFLLTPGMSNYKIITKLRSGAQDAIRVTINNVRDIEELSGKLSRYLSSDSSTLASYLGDSAVAGAEGYTRENFLALFIPNTYEMYWSTTPEKLVRKMARENEKFWNEDNRWSKADQLQLKPAEVYTLASIVEKESNYEPERPVIAGVYLNRLKQNMKLQADPTVVFALGVNGLQRVLLEHLNFVSPYNTYMNEGLPPGPIYMPSINSIDAVLNAEKHDFIFFCAKEGAEGRHNFASSLQQHAANARNYRNWLDKSNIK